mmetsp:Transcript_28298/g.91249  ORF Transcript_28298/g.91249 Transcript_28298/m.91249 type:complete len:362 (+) Transcript_28298:664-1749(+)
MLFVWLASVPLCSLALLPSRPTSRRPAKVRLYEYPDTPIWGLPISSEWELDCFSRPVTVDGKKLWELLVCDANGQWRDVVELPASSVNSVSLREAVEEVIDRAPVDPTEIRFFRKSMFNMLNIALTAVAENRENLKIAPSRRTHELFAWLDERNDEVYPEMEGYDSKLDKRRRSQKNAYGLDWKPPRSVTGGASRLPDALRGEKYAFVTLPLAEVLPNGGVTEQNVGVGKLLDATKVVDPDIVDEALDSFVEGADPSSIRTISGVALLSRRSEPLSMGLAQLEMAAIRADVNTRQLVLDVGLDESFLLAKLDDVQRDEAAAFEKSKAELNGLHFIVVQRPDDDEVEPAGFWLLRDVDVDDY